MSRSSRSSTLRNSLTSDEMRRRRTIRAGSVSKHRLAGKAGSHDAPWQLRPSHKPARAAPSVATGPPGAQRRLPTHSAVHHGKLQSWRSCARSRRPWSCLPGSRSPKLRGIAARASRAATRASRAIRCAASSHAALSSLRPPQLGRRHHDQHADGRWSDRHPCRSVGPCRAPSHSSSTATLSTAPMERACASS